MKSQRQVAVRRALTVTVATVALVASTRMVATASSVTSAVFSGASGTVTVSSALFAKQGAALTLTVVTSSDTKCVAVTGAVTLPRQTSAVAKSNWTFAATAPAGNGAQAFTVAASPNFNANNCTGQTNSTQASYTVDNTGPVVVAAVTPAPNAAGWNKSDVTVKWTATDAGSGVTAAQPFETDSVTANGDSTQTAAAQSDRLGNTGAGGSVTVRVDKAVPTITAAQVKNADGTTTITFTCADTASGIASCVADGLQSNSRTVAPGVTVSGTATDNAGNTSTATSTSPAADAVAPTITHAVAPVPNAAGWNKADAAVTFSCADNAGGSGLASCLADGTATNSRVISSETNGTVVGGTAQDNAGNTSTDSVTVRLDKTAPLIAASVDRAPNAAGWYDDDVTVSYAASDALSGVASKSADAVLGAGANQSASGTATDAAGNSASDGVSGINVDKAAPVLSGAFAAGWHTGDVTVEWSCTDGLSGPVGQPADSVVDGEGANLSATATCTDKAGNSTTETVSGIKIDRTGPTTGISVSGSTNNGWYQGGIDVSLDASDNVSGVAKTFYSIDGGAAKTYSAAVAIATDGTHTFTYWSVDGAGNIEDNTGNSITLKIDQTPPSLAGTFPAGWHTGDVAVAWSCSDATSGIDGDCPADSTVTGEGANLTASASVSDNAGNAASKTVTGIQIDRTAPTTTSQVADPNDNGWYGGAVLVTLTGHDSLSGVAATHYTVDGGEAQTYSGPFSFGAEGAHSIAFWSTDVAGNVENVGAPITLNIDTIAPTTAVINPVSPDSGWFMSSGIPVAFVATDSGSGVAATYYTIDGGSAQVYGEPFTAELSTGTHTITYWSVDLAGNEEAHETTNTVTVKVDTLPPTITGSATPAPNGFGWNNTDVEVKFTCTDSDSGVDGVAGCAGDTTLTNDGAGQSVHGDAVDVAGNKSSTDVTGIDIDQTKPTLTGAATTDANADGWYKGDVAIAWTGVDKLSGIDPATAPANSVIAGEGRNLGAGPVTVSDKAGNASDSVSATGINIDRKAPTVTGVLPAGKNAAGWYKGDVVVGFTCADPALADGSTGSGVAACPSDVMLKGDGANQSVTSAAATDIAGNASSGKTVGGINIDGHEPQTTADNQCTATNGYCKGTTATVVLKASDVGPSGVKEIHYTVNGGTEQVAAGSSKTISIPTDGTGSATFTYFAVDNAGNVEPTNSAALDYDNIAPTVVHTVTPAANAADWNNANVTVHFSAKDTDPGSGVVASSVTPDVTITTETSGTVVNGSATDTAGNVGTDSVIIRLDKTAPAITGAIVPGSAIVNGWYTGSVKVRFTCSDALSGIGVCPDDVTLTANGANQSVTRSAVDLAGNTAAATVSGISIDNENPAITVVNVAGGSYKLGAVPPATCTATDSFSGVATCTVVVTGGNANGVGTFAYTATAIDKAGNQSSQTGTFSVVYRFDGFLQPINDTAHQIGASTSVFKAGSTVPVKIQLRNAAGQLIQSAGAPVWLTPVRGSAMSVPVDEALYAASADSGSTFRYDAAAQHYIYNWSTKGVASGFYYRVGVRFDDGQTYYVNIGLR